MAYSTKGMLVLLRELLERDRRRQARMQVDGNAVKTDPKTAAPIAPRALTDAGWPTTSSFDLATASGEAHCSSATGSPLLGEQLPALRAELDRSRAAGQG